MQSTSVQNRLLNKDLRDEGNILVLGSGTSHREGVSSRTDLADRTDQAVRAEAGIPADSDRRIGSRRYCDLTVGTRRNNRRTPVCEVSSLISQPLLQQMMPFRTLFRILSALVLCVALNSIQSQPASLNQGLVAYYPFNGNANDESGNGYHQPSGTGVPDSTFFEGA